MAFHSSHHGPFSFDSAYFPRPWRPCEGLTVEQLAFCELLKVYIYDFEKAQLSLAYQTILITVEYRTHLHKHKTNGTTHAM